MSSAADNVPESVWSIVVSALRGLDAKRIVRVLVNKAFVAAARKVLGLRIRCTIAQIPRAIAVFESARELRVVGEAEGAGGACTGSLEAARIARAALERAGRFRVLVSDETHGPSSLAWLPRQVGEAGELRVVCQANALVGEALNELALARMTELEIHLS